MLRLYDTRRRAVAPLKPRGRVVTMYVCGVTPYDTTHLGHARTFLVFDLIARLLEAQRLRVRYAQNVTDVDESILARALGDGVDWRALGKREERRFLTDMRALRWRAPDVMPHATRELAGMRSLIERLVRRGAAYEVDGGMYFDVRRHSKYGALSRFSAAKMRRILAAQDDALLEDPRRRSPLDFALWRHVPTGPVWPSPYGKGRPGWHLECSAMALRHLGERIDIHGGGIDLVYPHHENEIAQTETATGKRPLAGHWVHVAPVRLGGVKMSKSLGNMEFVRDALLTTTPEALRLYLLDVHYRRNFDHDEKRLERARTRAAALARALGRGRRGPIGADSGSRAVLRALGNDLDAPRAIRQLEWLAPRATSERAKASLRALAGILGIA